MQLLYTLERIAAPRDAALAELRKQFRALTEPQSLPVPGALALDEGDAGDGSMRLALVELCGAGLCCEAPGAPFDSPVSTFLALPWGTWTHPRYGKLVFNQEIGDQIVRNFKARVTGVDLAIDYSHESEKEAAGWITELNSRPDGLYLTVRWTPDAAHAIRTGKWRYFSAELFGEEVWTHPKTGVTHQWVLMGGALTNRPFIKQEPGRPQLEVRLSAAGGMR